MNKKLELDKLRYNATKTFLIANVGIVISLTVAFWNVPENAKSAIAFMLYYFSICFILMCIAFTYSLSKLIRWYKN